MKKKILVPMLIFLVIIMSFCGCGKKEGSKTDGETVEKGLVYKKEDIDVGKENQNLNRLVRTKDEIYAYGYSRSDDGKDNTLNFYKLNEDGTTDKEYHIAIDEYISINSINMDDEAYIYCIKNDFHPVITEADWENEEYIGDSYEYVDDYYLTKMNLSGEEFFSIKLNDVPELRQLEEENGYFYIGALIMDKEKGIYVYSYDSLIKFDFEGNCLGITAKEEIQKLLGIADFISLNDGRTLASVYEENGGISLVLVELEKGTLGEKYTIPGRSYEYAFYPGVGYDLFLVNSYGVYGYNLGDADKTQLMSYIDSDLDFNNLNNVMGINEKSFFAVYSEMETGNSILAKFTKVPPEDVKEKQVITLAMAETDWSIRSSVIKFNKKNDDYRISILDYSSLYGSDNDYMAGINRLNADIVSGKVPDILVINYTMPVDSYISKGLLEDIKPYIEEDAELDINNFMPNIMEAFSVEGKTYMLVPFYSIQTLIAKAADVGDERGWTVQEAVELLRSKPEGTQLLANATRDEVLWECMTMSSNQFIDWEKGTCSFNSEDFIQMLEFIGSFPEELSDEAFGDEYWNNYDSMYRQGLVLATGFSVSSFQDYNRAEKGNFGEDITMIGFPSSNEDGSVIMPGLQLALSAKSNYKEGAWEFLRTFLMDEYQEENVTYCFPLSMKRLDELAMEAMEKPYYLDENGNKVEYDNVYYIGEEEIVIPPMTKQETEEFIEQLQSFTQIYRSDDTLLNIIQEEAAPYFAGQKSAKDVAAIIQSRVQIYVNESR